MSLSSLKHELYNLQQELAKQRKRKEDTEKFKQTTVHDIYTGKYSTEHLQKHSLRLRANSELRETEKQIKKLEEQIANLKQKLDNATNPRKPESNYLECTVSHNSMNGNVTPVDDHDTIEDGRENFLDANNHTQNAGEVDNFGSEHNVETTDDAFSLQSENVDSPQVNSSNISAIESATWLVSDYLQSLQDTESSSEFIVGKANALVSLLKKNPEIKNDLVISAFSNTIQNLLLSEDKVITSAGYRVCRYLITDIAFVEFLLKLRLDSFLIISLAKDNSYHIEREQAIKLIRSFVEYKAGVTTGIAQAIISCIERPDDCLRNIALETLLEICYTNPTLVKQCSGIPVLENIINEHPSFHVSQAVLETLLDLMSYHETRQFFISGFKANSVLVALSDYQSKSSLNVEKLQNCIVLISICLKNLNGLMLFSTNNFKPLRELISFFQVPMLVRYLIDLFLDVLRIKPLPYPSKKTTQVFKTLPSQFQSETIAMNQYVALLVKILSQVGFLEQLLFTFSGNNNSENTSNVAKTRYLLSEFYSLSMNLVGIDPKFFNLHISNLIPSKTLFLETFQFEKITNKLNKNRNTIGMAPLDLNSNIHDFSRKMKHRALVQDVDEVRFKKMVYDSKVLQTKSFLHWNWNILSELLQGPLLNPKRLEELTKTTKFVRRLLVFYRPMRHRFSSVKKGSRLSNQYIQVGCDFFRMLTSHSEGMKILTDDTKIIPQIASSLYKAMEGQWNGNIFSPSSMKSSICMGYLKILGVLTQSTNGIHILERWNIFTVIYKMFQPHSKLSHNLLLGMLPELSLKYSSHCRNIVRKALASPDEEVRIAAAELLGKLLAEAEGELEELLLDLLVRQLYDLSSQVVEVADRILYDYCMDHDWSEGLNSSLCHSLNQLVFIGSPILFELLSTPPGFQQLSDINFVESERDAWLSHKNRDYVYKVDEFLEAEKASLHENHIQKNKKKLPLHLYESLASTDDGITLISQSGDLVGFMNVIKRYCISLNERFDTEEIVEVKAALWCCGFIGSTELGIGLLDNYSIVNDIVKISYWAPVTSVRCTAFHVLGLISITQEGCEILDELEWDSCLNIQGIPSGVTLPNNLSRFLQYPEIVASETTNPNSEFMELPNDGEVEEYQVPDINLDKLLFLKEELDNPIGDEQKEMKEEIEKRMRIIEASEAVTEEEQEDEISEKIVHTVSNLGNHILSNSAIKEITELESKYGATRFETPEMFMRVMGLMDRYRFKPQARKFLCELFINKRALEGIIKKDRKRKK